MNKAQKRVAIVICIVIVLMFLFPPVTKDGAYRGYEFIASITPGLNINVALLFVQLLGILLVGALVFFIARTGSPLIDRETNEDHKNFKPK
ncbi:MAG: hypothetical protein MZV70_28080 [Desulfobacterales bacterium]|nr:hypothetical protein [Desulfobacterales bacterium]